MHARTLSVAAGILLATTSTIADQPLSFWKPVESTVADRPVARAAIGDLNRDGLPDLVVSTPDIGTIGVALGRGDGGFRGPANYSVSSGPGHLALGDFNNDGNLDVVIAASGITVLLGRGDGSFESPIFSRGSARAVVVADFDRDGNLDIAGIGHNHQSMIPETIDVYPGLGDGTFGGFRTMYANDNNPNIIAVGDFNGDGWPDLVIPVATGRFLGVYLNQGAFTFASAGSNFTEFGPSALGTADVDGNGTVDLVTSNFLGTFSVLFGNGDGTLQAKRDFPAAGNGPLTLADLNGDDLLDVIITTALPGTATILLNTGGGSFSPPHVLDVLPRPTFVGTGDFDADGSIDVAVISTAAGYQDDGTRIVSTFRNKLRPKGKDRTR